MEKETKELNKGIEQRMISAGISESTRAHLIAIGKFEDAHNFLWDIISNQYPEDDVDGLMEKEQEIFVKLREELYNLLTQNIYENTSNLTFTDI